MKSSLHGKSLRSIFVIALGVCFAWQPLSVALAEPDSPKPDVEQSEQEKSLLEHWKKHQDSLTTLHIKYNSFLHAGDEFQSLKPDDVHKIFDPEDLVEDPKLLNDVLKQLLNVPLKRDPPWGEIEFFSDGKKTREERAKSVQVYDGECEIYRDGWNRHIKLGWSRDEIPMHRNTREDFCYIPNMGLFGIVKYIESSSMRDKFVLRAENSIQGDVSWFEVSKTTRMVERSMLVFGDGDSQNAKLIVQGGWTEFLPRFHWPRAYGEFEFRGKPPVLKFARIRITTSVEFDEPVDSEKFIVAAQPADTVFDYRKEGDVSCYQVPDGADDVKKTSE